MASRRKRKRERGRRREATAQPQGGQGDIVALTRSDLVLLRRAVRGRWPVDAARRLALVDATMAALESGEPRRAVSAAKVFLEMD